MATGMTYPELERCWHRTRLELLAAQAEARRLREALERVRRPWWRRALAFLRKSS